MVEKATSGSDERNTSSAKHSMYTSEYRDPLSTRKIDTCSKEKPKQCRSQIRFAISVNEAKNCVLGNSPAFKRFLCLRLPNINDSILEVISFKYLLRQNLANSELGFRVRNSFGFTDFNSMNCLKNKSRSGFSS